MDAIACLSAYEARRPAQYAVVDRYRNLFFDSFMDVVGGYLEWRHLGKKPGEFLARQLQLWEVSIPIPPLPGRIVMRMIEEGGATLLIHDDATISTALAQLAVDGKVAPSTRSRAIACVDRQLLPLVIRARGYSDPQAAETVFLELKRLLGTTSTLGRVS